MKLSNSNRFYLQGTNKRFIHLATILDSLREYICMYDTLEQKVYVEEVVGGQLYFIDDDNIAKELADFLFDKHITDITYGVAASDYNE